MVERSETLTQRLRHFGRQIRGRREALALSQEAFADKCGLHRTYIGQVERGERNLSLGNAYGVADALGVSLTELLSR